MTDKRILVIAAHPDDEVLGCGASIRKWKNSKNEINTLILAEGITSRYENTIRKNGEINILRRSAQLAANIIGYDKVFFENYPDNRLDGINMLEITKKIEYYLKKLKPQIILTHHYGDLNIDHRITYQAVITACRPIHGSMIEAIYSFQIPSSTEWNFPYRANGYSPNFFVDVEKTIDDKIAALSCYKTELRSFPHPRSCEVLRAISTVWGSVVGLHCAEAFETIFKIDKD